MIKFNMSTIKLLIFICPVLFFTCQSVASQGQLKFSLSAVAEAGPTQSWSIVFPNHLVFNNAHFSLLNAKGKVIEATFNSILLWPDQGASKYQRSIQITTSKKVPLNTLTLKWQDDDIPNINKPISFSHNTHHAILTANWLTQSYYAPMLEANAYQQFSWFDNANEHYANYITSPELMKKRKLTIETAAPWLYDRPLALYLLYFKTGSLYWKVQAHKAATFYKNNIDELGNFSLKPNDMKYSNTQGLLFDYLFYPRKDTLEVITNLYKKTTKWQPIIKTEGFWTERHHSVALAAAISYWAIFNDNKALNRIELFNENLSQKLQNDICLSHPYESHEGKKLDTNVCSPWMTAQLIEQLWRFHHLSFSFESVKTIGKLGDFLANEGIFHHTYGKEYSAVPKYLANLNDRVKQNISPWSDLHHACDVSSALSKAIYLNKFLVKDQTVNIKSLNLMLKTCHRSMRRTNPNEAWPIVPLRKFNWWYTTTGSFTWLMKKLEIIHPQR